jgi:hypothetical protein
MPGFAATRPQEARVHVGPIRKARALDRQQEPEVVLVIERFALSGELTGSRDLSLGDGLPALGLGRLVLNERNEREHSNCCQDAREDPKARQQAPRRAAPALDDQLGLVGRDRRVSVSGGLAEPAFRVGQGGTAES